MKQGKRPTKKQKQAIANAGLNADNWLVTKNLQETERKLHIVHRLSGNHRQIPA